MRVLLVCNWDDQCGVSTYGQNLLRFADPSMVELVPFEIGRPPHEMMRASLDVDVVHINYQRGVSRPFDPAVVSQIPRPVVYNNQITLMYEPWYTDLAAIVIHGPNPSLQAELPHVKVREIPHGVVDLPLPEKPEPKGIVLGQSGFPFPHKRHDLVCQAAVALRSMGHTVGVYLIMPSTYRTNPSPLIHACWDILGDIPAEFVTEWLKEDEVIRRLHENTTVCVHPGGGGGGISGSVRLSISSHTPVVLNGEGPLFADLLKEDGIYPYYGIEELVPAILQAQGQPGALDLIKRMSFAETMKMYCDFYQEVLDTWNAR